MIYYRRGASEATAYQVLTPLAALPGAPLRVPRLSLYILSNPFTGILFFTYNDWNKISGNLFYIRTRFCSITYQNMGLSLTKDKPIVSINSKCSCRCLNAPSPQSPRENTVEGSPASNNEDGIASLPKCPVKVHTRPNPPTKRGLPKICLPPKYAP